MITSEQLERLWRYIFNHKIKEAYKLYEQMSLEILQQEKVNELLKEHIQLSYNFEDMLVNGIKNEIEYTETAMRLLTVREKLQKILNWRVN